jgi:hypothetical protein
MTSSLSPGPAPIDQQRLGEPVELADVAEGELAQPGPQGGGGHHVVAQHPPGRPRAQQVGVVDAVRPGQQRVDQRQRLAARPVADADQLIGRLLQPEMLREGRGQHQPRVGHSMLVVEADLHAVQSVIGSAHRKSASCWGRTLGLVTRILPGQEALLVELAPPPP